MIAICSKIAKRKRGACPLGCWRRKLELKFSPWFLWKLHRSKEFFSEFRIISVLFFSLSEILLFEESNEVPSLSCFHNFNEIYNEPSFHNINNFQSLSLLHKFNKLPSQFILHNYNKIPNLSLFDNFNEFSIHSKSHHSNQIFSQSYFYNLN